MKIKIALVFTMLIFGSIGIFTVQISIPSVAIVQWRAIIAFVFLLAFFLISKKKINVKAVKKSIIPLAFSGVMLGANWVFLFEAYKYTSVGVGTIIYYFAPIFVFILIPIVFKEKIRKEQTCGICVALIGMILVNFESLISSQFSVGIIYAFVAALLYALIIISNRFVSGISGFESTLVQLLISAVVMTIYSFVSSGTLLTLPSGKDVIFVLILGIVHTGIAYSIYFYALQKIKPQVSSLLSYIDPASALLFSFLFLNEKLSFCQIVGAVLIFVGTILPRFLKKYMKKKL